MRRAALLPALLPALLLLPPAAAAQEEAAADSAGEEVRLGPAGADGGEARTEVGGGVYLFHHAPVDLEGADHETEIYAAFVTVDHRSGPWTFHGEARWRDTKLREFYPSTTWVQEAWAAYRVRLGRAGGAGAGDAAAAGEDEAAGGGSPGGERRPELTLRAGKIYTRLGRFWDGSFFGNLHYFDGLKLDPDFGAEAVLDLPVGAATVEVRGQYLVDDDRVNGALGRRDLEGSEAGDEAGSPLGAVHVEVPLLGPPPGAGPGAGPRLRLRAGVSGFLERGTVEPEAGGAAAGDADVELRHVAVDGGLEAWGHRAYVEYTDRGSDGAPPAAAGGPAGSAAEYWLAGVQLHFPPVHLRYNYSRAAYATAGFDERIHQPGVTVDLRDWLHALVEYDDWLRTRAGGGGARRLDRSVSLVLLVDL